MNRSKHLLAPTGEDTTLTSQPLPTQNRSILNTRYGAPLPPIDTWIDSMEVTYSHLDPRTNSFNSTIKFEGERLDLTARGILSNEMRLTLTYYKGMNTGQRLELQCGNLGCKTKSYTFKDKERVLNMVQAFIAKLIYDIKHKKDVNIRDQNSIKFELINSAPALDEGMSLIIMMAGIIVAGLFLFSMAYCLTRILRTEQVQAAFRRIFRGARPESISTQRDIEMISAVVIAIVEQPGDTEPSYVLETIGPTTTSSSISEPPQRRLLDLEAAKQ